MKPAPVPISILVSLAILITSATSTSTELTYTCGKYNRQILTQQFQYCHDSSCPGCMRTWFADPWNPFDNNNNNNCDGLHHVANFGYHLLSELCDPIWESFILLTAPETLENAVTKCLQHYQSDVHCLAWNPTSETNVMITGAYQIGSTIQIGMLDDFIDRSECGQSVVPNMYDWSDLQNYVQYAADDFSLDEAGYWKITYFGCLAYWADSAMGSPPVIAGEGTKSMDENFAQKCLAHALVCWQASEWENGQAEIDIIGPNGIEPWPYDISQTPAFVYQMRDALIGILYLPVSGTKSSWGSLKAQYR